MTTHHDPHDDLVRRLEEDLLAPPLCQRCKGSGEVKWNPGWPDPQCEESAPCSCCGGDGVLDPRSVNWHEHECDVAREERRR